jgi:hypothetical protein
VKYCTFVMPCTWQRFGPGGGDWSSEHTSAGTRCADVVPVRHDVAQMNEIVMRVVVELSFLCHDRRIAAAR